MEVASTVNAINDPNFDMIEKAKVYMAYIPSKDDIVGKMRPWIPEFCPDMDSFSVPKGPSHLWARTKANLSRFHMNYALIASIFVVWSLVSESPFLLVCLAFFFACTYLAWMNAEATIRTYMSYKSVKWSLVGLLLLFIALIVMSIATWLTFMAGMVITLHAVFRDEKLLTREGSGPTADEHEVMGELLNGDSENLQRRK